MACPYQFDCNEKKTLRILPAQPYWQACAGLREPGHGRKQPKAQINIWTRTRRGIKRNMKVKRENKHKINTKIEDWDTLNINAITNTKIRTHTRSMTITSTICAVKVENASLRRLPQDNSDARPNQLVNNQDCIVRLFAALILQHRMRTSDDCPMAYRTHAQASEVFQRCLPQCAFDDVSL